AEAPRDGAIPADQGVDQDQIEEQEGDDRDPKERSPAAAAVPGIRVVLSSQPFQSEDRTSKSCPPLHQLLPLDLWPSCTLDQAPAGPVRGEDTSAGIGHLLTGFAAPCARARPRHRIPNFHRELLACDT